MRFVSLFCAVLLMACVMRPASAAELTWHFQSDYPYTVDVELFSQDRNHVWPGNDRVWSLDDYATHDISISCMYGEKICYGASARGNSSTYWGVGPEGNEGCENCCARCGYGDPSLKHLLP